MSNYTLGAWLRQDYFAAHLMRYQTPFASVAYTVNTSPPIEGDYIASATPQWSSGSLQLHDTYERDVVPAITVILLARKL